VHLRIVLDSLKSTLKCTHKSIPKGLTSEETKQKRIEKKTLQQYGIKVRCYGEHVGEQIGNTLRTYWELKWNIMGTYWEPRKNEKNSFPPQT
jgi:hypothetical protein